MGLEALLAAQHGEKEKKPFASDVTKLQKRANRAVRLVAGLSDIKTRLEEAEQEARPEQQDHLRNTHKNSTAIRKRKAHEYPTAT